MQGSGKGIKILLHFLRAIGTELFVIEKMRDAGEKIPEYSLIVPQYLIDMAWDETISLNSFDEKTIKYIKDSFDEAIAVRGTSICRDFTKKNIGNFNQYSRYIDLRAVDGFWRFSTILVLAAPNEGGRSEDADSPSVRKFIEASAILFEEGSRARRTIDDENCGYWLLVNTDELEARRWGRNRAKILYRQGWDEMVKNNIHYLALLPARGTFLYIYHSLPGSEVWLAFEALKKEFGLRLAS